MSDTEVLQKSSGSLSTWRLVRDALSTLATLQDNANDTSGSDAGPSHSEDAESLTVLGDTYIQRYKNLGSPEDLNDAIAAYTRALEVTPDGQPNMRIRVINYGSAIQCRFVKCGDAASASDFEIAIFSFTFAAEVTPDHDPDKARILSLLGSSILTRLQHLPGSFRVDDVDGAVAAHRRAVELTPDDDPERPCRFSQLGRTLTYRYQRLYFEHGAGTYLEDAVAAHRQAVELTHDGHREKTSRLSELAGALINRFQYTHDPEDLEDALGSTLRAILISPEGHIERPVWQYNVADYIHMRFMHSGKPKDLEDAVAEIRKALDITPEEHTIRPLELHRLGALLLNLFDIHGHATDLDDSIAAHHDAVRLTPDGDTEKFRRLSSLATSAFRRYERFGNPGDLDTAITGAQRATELLTRAWDQAWFHDSLGHYAWTRWERESREEDLETAISAYTEAVKYTIHDDADKPRKLSNLALALSCRFQRYGKLEDLEKRIEHARLAVDLSIDGDINKPWRLLVLGDALQSRYERLYELGDLEGAITAYRRASESIPDDHSDKPLWLSRLAVSLGSRFERLGSPEDLHTSLEIAHCVDALTPDEHAFKTHALTSLSSSLSRRFEYLGDPQDLQDAIIVQRRAVDATPDTDPAKPVRLSTLATLLHHRSDCIAESGNDLVAAQALHERAIELNPDQHPDNAWMFERSADCLRSLFEREKTHATFVAAIKRYDDAAGQTQGPIYSRFRSAEACVNLLSSYPDFSSPESLLSAYSRIMHILPDIIWFGHTVKRRLEEVARMGGLAGTAASAATAVGDVAHAVEWLEAGRALVWSHITNLSAPADELRETRPDLAAAVSDIQYRLAVAGLGVAFERPRETYPSEGDIHRAITVTPTSEGDRYRRLVVEYEGLVGEIRNCPGFEDFLRPKAFESLQSSLKHAAGPVVFLNVSSLCCNAVIVTSQTSKIIPLPSLTEENAQLLCARWLKGLRSYGVRQRATKSRALDAARGKDRITMLSRGVLEPLWRWAILPVLDALGIVTQSPSNEELPHIIWCPTGALLQLPLHAAGLYVAHDPMKSHSRTCLHDFAVSSYTPSLSALVRCLRGTRNEVAVPRVLVVAQPDTGRGLSPLPCVTEESDTIRRILPAEPNHTFLHRDEATVLSTFDVVNEHPWVHFACHGCQNPDDPTLSSFELHDGPLTLANLMTDRTADESELAFLSACQTATGDEKVPEESMHLAAGMLAIGFKGVVATMWSITDEDAPVIVEAYYTRLLELRASGTLAQGETGAARALHDAVGCLRERIGESAFERWAPFIHFGA
ncbi:unnamed protein product [Peniophora sp. CBMAI 1063]|nr:unnamed protein product [Peniophora sp. CBMAI 1063]